jgi:hypothetical protein
MTLWIDTNNTLHDDMDGAALTLPSWPTGMTQATAEQIAAVQNPAPTAAQVKAQIQSQIDFLESQQLLPRITREFMLSAAEAQAKAAGVDPNVNVGYAKLKEFDTQIAGLRGQL